MQARSLCKVFMAAIVCFFAQPALATFSIVAFDPETGDLGVAVASLVFGVGNHVPWAEPGVGAVATQAHMNGSYGPRGLELLKQGLSAQQVVDQLLAEDPYPRKEGRQVAVVDAKGSVAVYTGPLANEWRGHITGTHYSVQGNILAGQHVVQAMAAAFESSRGELAERLYAALKAGDDAGGDRRGRQSAGLMVVRKGGGSAFANDRLAYVNVNDHKDPVHELGRQLPLQLAWSLRGKRAPLVALGKYADAMLLADNLVRWEPHNSADRIHQGFIAYLMGDEQKAIDSIQQAKAIDPDKFAANWTRAIEASETKAAYDRLLSDKKFVPKLAL
ncbi:DUF1028 domain-containing protein [Povalibacter sp.]|uniref:DUF1028 domain-containing protein n=1 Tax=Povalibacter sp. TaxID=1962978 RepID=UPI002F3F7565